MPGKPERTAAQEFDLARHLLADRQLEAAMSMFSAAEEHGFDADGCAAGRWECCMLSGDFPRAWLESDAIAGRGAPDPNALWSGAGFSSKKVVLRCLHGLGDAIQFIRLAPFVRESASRVIVEVPKCLVSLFRNCSGIDRVVTWEHPEPYEWDEQVEIMELPRIFRLDPAMLPAQALYLHPSSDALESPAANRIKRDRKIRIGLRWGAGEWNLARSIPLRSLGSWLLDDRFSFYSLQVGEARAELLCVRSGTRIAEPIGDNLELERTAAIVRELDLVVTVDTMIAHLAGALGRPVWLLLTYAADWRWMVGRNDSPWYPSMRIFRQPAPGDWDSVVSDLKHEADRFANEYFAPGMASRCIFQSSRANS